MRIFICSAIIILLAGCQLGKDQAMAERFAEATSPLYDPDAKPFYHGVYPEHALADWYFVQTILKPDTTETLARSFNVNAKSNTLE